MKLIALFLFSTFLIPCRFNNPTESSPLIGKWYIKKITMFDGSVKKADDGKGCLAKSYVIFSEDHKMYNRWFFDAGADTCFASKTGSTDYRVEDGNKIVSSEGTATFKLKDKNTLVIQFDLPKKEDSKITFNFKSIEYIRQAE